MRNHSLRALFVFALVLTALLALAGLALAQEDGAGGTVVAEGFNGPMGVLVDPNGDVWVTDSGFGGEEPISVFNPEAGGMVSATVGNSARVVQISVADGSMTEVATLPSYGAPELGGSGGGRLALLDGALYASVSDWDSQPGNDPPAGIASIMSIAADGTTEIVFDAWAWEAENNPYGVVYHSHPYGLTPDEEAGVLWVADAGANAIYTLDPVSGEVEVKAVLEPLPGVFPRPDYDGEMLTDPVPTSVAVKDGAVYVSLLSGAPFIPGSAKVLTLADDGTTSDYATGLTMLIDMRTGPDGELYAVSFGMSGEEGFVPNSGSVLRIQEGDASEVLLSGLSFPSSIDFDADGNAYVTIDAVGAPGSGAVLKFDALTEATGMSVAEMMAAMAPPDAAATEAAEVEATEAMTESEPAAEPGSLDIVDTAVAAGQFGTLASAITERGLVDALKGEGPFTVFAPSDGAFQGLPLTDRIKLYRDPDALTQTLLYHVVPGVFTAADLTDGMTLETLQGGTLTVTLEDGAVLVNGVKVSAADVAASNGVIHVLDSVIMLGADAEAAPVEEEAPAEETATEEAAPEEAAATEVVTETVEMAETTAMTETTESAATESTTATEAPAELPATGNARQDLVDIVATAVGAGNFTTLVAAVEAAGLVDALQGEGPFTVFAPTDAAFAQIPQETLDALLADPSGNLTQILLYHVVPGQVLAADVTDGLTAETLQGGTVTFTVADGAVKINEANIIATDVLASNGVIHVIDAVILPPTDDAMAAEAAPAEAAPAEAASTEAAPAEMPATGAAAQSSGLTLAVTALVLLLLVGATMVTRRRSA